MALFKKTKKKKTNLTKEQQKLLAKQKARAKKRKKRFMGQQGFVNDEDGYVDFDSYTKVGKNYYSVFDILVRYGTHHTEIIGWLTKVIPTTAIQSGDIYFALREKGMGKGTEDSVLGKTLNARVKTMTNNEDSSDFREQTKKSLAFQDIMLARSLSKDENIIDSDLVLVVKSDSPEKIEETLNELRQSYKDDGIGGFMLVRRTANILDALMYQYVDIFADIRHNSDMQTVSANRLFLPSSGFSDIRGTYCGVDIHSYIENNPALIDFNGIRHAVVITGGISGKVSVGGIEQPAMISNYGSAWAHVIAEDNYLVNGTRTHFINLVNLDYHFPDSLVFDMNKYTINSLEVYGTKETVERDANANFDKVVEIIMMLLEEDEQDPEIKSSLRTQLVDWMIKRAGGGGLYSSDPKHEPTRAWRILATTNHATYPTISDFVTTELNTMVSNSYHEGGKAISKAKTLKNTVKTASERYPTVFAEKTNLPDSFSAKDRNIYYDLSTITDNEVVKGAMFLNTLAYAVKRAKPGDMLVVTGIDTIKINPRILRYYRDTLDNKGVGLIVTFERREDDNFNVRTLNDFVHPLNTQDLVVLGGLTSKSSANIQYSWNQMLPDVVYDTLSDNIPSRFYVYRAWDFASAILQTQLIL